MQVTAPDFGAIISHEFPIWKLMTPSFSKLSHHGVPGDVTATTVVPCTSYKYRHGGIVPPSTRFKP
jgi:hypothetical protein